VYVFCLTTETLPIFFLGYHFSFFLKKNDIPHFIPKKGKVIDTQNKLRHWFFDGGDLYFWKIMLTGGAFLHFNESAMFL
jgi:hypothetical protein